MPEGSTLALGLAALAGAEATGVTNFTGSGGSGGRGGTSITVPTPESPITPDALKELANSGPSDKTLQALADSGPSNEVLKEMAGAVEATASNSGPSTETLEAVAEASAPSEDLVSGLTSALEETSSAATERAKPEWVGELESAADTINGAAETVNSARDTVDKARDAAENATNGGSGGSGGSDAGAAEKAGKGASKAGIGFLAGVAKGADDLYNGPTVEGQLSKGLTGSEDSNIVTESKKEIKGVMESSRESVASSPVSDGTPFNADGPGLKDLFSDDNDPISREEGNNIVSGSGIL